MLTSTYWLIFWTSLFTKIKKCANFVDYYGFVKLEWIIKNGLYFENWPFFSILSLTIKNERLTKQIWPLFFCPLFGLEFEWPLCTILVLLSLRSQWYAPTNTRSGGWNIRWFCNKHGYISSFSLKFYCFLENFISWNVLRFREYL